MAGATNPTRDTNVSPGERGNAAPRTREPADRPSGTGHHPLSRGLSDAEAAHGILGLLGGGEPATPGKPRRQGESTQRRTTDDDDATPAGSRAGDPDALEDDGSNEDDDELTHQRDDDAPNDDADADDGEPQGPDADDPDPDADLDDEPDPQFLKRKVRVKSDGVESEVTIDELRRGYQRHQTFSRKTAELATRQQQVDQVGAAVMQQRQILDEVLQQQVAVVHGLMGPEPDWRRLSIDDPTGYVQMRAAWDERTGQLNQIQQLRALNAQHAQAQMQHARALHVEAEGRKMLQLRPEWADPTKGAAVRDRMLTYAKRYGFSQDEIGGITDSRVLFILADAAEHDERIARARKRVEQQRNRMQRQQDDEEEPAAPAPRPQTAPPGPARERRDTRTVQQRELARAKSRLAKTGRDDDAAAAIFHLL